jgi:excinuclease ABC subunit B
MRGKKPNYYVESENQDNVAADPLIQYMSRTQLEKLIEETERKMKASAKDLDFISAAKYRDEMQALKKKLPEKLV